MKKLLISILLSAGLALTSGALQATEDQMTFENKQQEQLYKELIKELRCPKCQNQNIADSNAVVAKDMRVKTKELVDQGQDKEQVIDYMVNRYGQFAHYQPPLNVATSMLWLLPISFVLIAILFLIRRSKRTAPIAGQKQTNEQASTQDEEQQEAIDQEQLNKKLDEELAQLMAEEGKDK